MSILHNYFIYNIIIFLLSFYFFHNVFDRYPLFSVSIANLYEDGLLSLQVDNHILFALNLHIISTSDESNVA